MKIPYKWLKEYVDFDLSPQQLARALTMAGTEVTALQDVGEPYRHVIVAEVVSKRKHPGADRLSLCEVNAGSEVLCVVCGAPNVAPGQKVPLALVGAKLPCGLEVKKAKIRGVSSSGMICSQVELGLGDDASGIMVLDNAVPQGTPLGQALDLDDVVLETEITLNRPDCMSLIGIAREVRALTHQPLRMPTLSVPEGGCRAEDLASVVIDDPKGCPRYAARVVTGVKVGPSPLWLQRRLERCGLRPINNVVDVTNYVLLEMGHPLHAFDLNTLTAHRIVVRRAQEGEACTTLDGVQRALSSEVLVIADPQRPVAVAGVMGGLSTQVSQQTVDLLIESAYFSPSRVRKGSRLLDLSTEASRRFERGADPEGNVPALNRAAALIAQLAGGQVAQGVLDVYPGKRPQTVVAFRPARVQVVLGQDIPRRTQRTILSQLGCTVSGRDVWDVTVPTFRPDLEREIDLMEELARIYGYNSIPNREVAAGALHVEVSDRQRLQRTTSDLLTSLGLTEVVTNTLVSPDMEQLLGRDALAPPIANPSNREMSVLRTALLPSLLSVARWNLNRQVEEIRIFELGKVFAAHPDGDITERLEVAGLMACHPHQPYWDEESRTPGFLELKGVLERYLSRISLDKTSIIDYDGAVYDPQQSATVLLSGTEAGHIGRVHPDLLDQFDISGPVYGFALDFEVLLRTLGRDGSYKPLPRFPAVERDIAVVLDDEIPAQEVTEAILSVDPVRIESARLFDVYRGKQVPAGKKSLAFALRFRAPDYTLIEEQVNQLYATVVEQLRGKFSAMLRD